MSDQVSYISGNELSAANSPMTDDAAKKMVLHRHVAHGSIELIPADRDANISGPADALVFHAATLSLLNRLLRSVWSGH
jgi:hypothetical protein